MTISNAHAKSVAIRHRGMETPLASNQTVRLNDVIESSRLAGLLKHYGRRAA